MTLTLKPYHMKSGETKLGLESPYHPNLPPLAKKLGGKWNGADGRWYFDVRDVERVRKICTDVYGLDPLAEEPADLVTVRLTVAYGPTNTEWRFGRELYRRPSRDSEVRLGDGVVIIEGSFPHHGGSTRYPSVFNNPDEGAVTLEVRDVPRAAVEADPEGVEIVETPDPKDVIHEAVAATNGTIGQEPNEVEKLWEQIGRLSAQERAALLGKLLAAS